MSTSNPPTTLAETGQLQEVAEPRAARSGVRYFFKRFASESPLNIVALGIITLFFILVVFGNVLAPHDPLATNAQDRFLPPSLEHPFGTDEIGRDILSRVMSGARYSLGVAVLILVIAIPIGTLVGVVAAGGL